MMVGQLNMVNKHGRRDSNRDLQAQHYRAEEPAGLEQGHQINRPLTTHQSAFQASRTGFTALLLSTTTELFIINLIAQHDPQPDSQLARHCDASAS